ncbi:hypothetical protein SAMN02745165_01745 [Malonomonas rubra DSM 5091]|uniref:Uncharacterized protein n=1 Tax=Malonomonas rubra DSM 5091 TaxID=1122189 RepID=A0A1M6H9H6_MALRU|nr:hypothetical protein [Malonomonas rubra]SHJ18867.1 hypothetical protein SAMN02745165_01745 [Malonomonas rubra DSM 5091]
MATDFLNAVIILLALPTLTFLLKIGIKMLSADSASFKHNRGLCEKSPFKVIKGSVGINTRPDYRIKQGMAIDSNNRLVRQSSFSEEAINKIIVD